MSLITPSEFAAASRLDLMLFTERAFGELHGSTAFQDAFYLHVIAHALDRVRTGKCKRLLINVTPRGAKSLFASIAFPAFVLGHDPTTKFICASYGQDLADDLGRSCRQVMMSNWYRGLFPAARLAPNKMAIGDFGTVAGGFRMATSVGGVLTGFGADIIVIDDPMKPDQAYSVVERGRANSWFSHTLMSRLNNKKTGAIIVVMQRLHAEDFVSYIQSLDDWEVLSFPAIAERDERWEISSPFGTYVHRRSRGEALHPAREDLKVLEQLRRNLGPANFNAQYQQRPMPPDGGMIKLKWFHYYVPGQTPDFDYIFQSWDTANKAHELADFSVCTTWGVKGGHYYLLDVLRERLEFPDLLAAVRSQAKLFGAKHIVIEDKGSGTQLLQTLQLENIGLLTAYKPEGDKVVRMAAQAAAFSAGKVFLPTEAHWLVDYVEELTMFPQSRHFDQVDSTSQALDWVRKPHAGEGWLQFYKEEFEAMMRGRSPDPDDEDDDPDDEGEI